MWLYDCDGDGESGGGGERGGGHGRVVMYVIMISLFLCCQELDWNKALDSANCRRSILLGPKPVFSVIGLLCSSV